MTTKHSVEFAADGKAIKSPELSAVTLTIRFQPTGKEAAPKLDFIEQLRKMFFADTKKAKKKARKFIAKQITEITAHTGGLNG